MKDQICSLKLWYKSLLTPHSFLSLSMYLKTQMPKGSYSAECPWPLLYSHDSHAGIK